MNPPQDHQLQHGSQVHWRPVFPHGPLGSPSRLCIALRALIQWLVLCVHLVR